MLGYLACVVLGYGIAKLGDQVWMWYGAKPHERTRRRLEAKRNQYRRTNAVSH